MLLSLLKAKGHSMEPKINNGSFFLASSLPFVFRKPRIGDIVIFKSGDRIIVKKISKIESNKYIIKGENEMDSFKFKPIKRNEILGKVVCKF